MKTTSSLNLGVLIVHTNSPDSFANWGKILILAIILGMGVRGYAEALKFNKGDDNAISLIMNPMMILNTAGEAVVKRTDQLFEGVIKVGNELTSSIGVIRETIFGVSQMLRSLYGMVTSFVIRFQQLLQGVMGSALGIFTNIRNILTSLMETMGVVMYTMDSGMNLSKSVMNGPPGQAMKTMADLINKLGGRR
jgi:phage-related protein